ncbi:hypothetical protein [Calycomorphotria hydatis]|nr:hypothetical protein [Calycomorphotria hydatis]
MNDSPEVLQALLHEKEELVEALTERLEQAAEQLDRIQRNGSDRGVRVSGGIPSDIVEQQRTLCTDLQGAVDQWEQMQCASTLGSIEAQLAELRDLFTQGGVQAAFPQGNQSPVAHNPGQSHLSSGEGENSIQSGWEAMKAGILESAGADEPQIEQPQYEQVPHYDSQIESPVEQNQFEEPTGSLDPPQVINVDAASVEELKFAVTERDAFISELIRRYRSLEQSRQPVGNWQDLEAVPDDLRHRLTVLEEQLNEALRLSEVEISLERARLGREEMRLKQLDENAQKALERLGIAQAEIKEEMPGEGDDESNRRWLRMLGIRPE